MNNKYDPNLRWEFQKNSEVLKNYESFATQAECQLQELFQELFPNDDFVFTEFQKRCLKTFAIGLDNQFERYQDLSWPIPNNANLDRGDFGLLPGDSTIEEWAIPTTSGMILKTLVEHFKPQIILEMGMSLGYSTSCLASGIDLRKNPGIVLTTEIFEPKIKIATDNFQKLGLSDLIEVNGQISELLDRLVDCDKIGFVFMDADKQNYLLNFQKFFPMLKQNSIIVVDNVKDYPHFMQDFLLYGSIGHF